MKTAWTPFFSTLIAALLSGCASPHGSARPTLEVFSNTDAFLGKVVTLCGYVHDRSEDQNIWPSKADVDGDLGIGLVFTTAAAKRPKIDGRSTCLSGTIVRRECGEKMICTASNYEFALRVDD